MPRYISLHILGCLPKPAFAALCAKLFTAASTPIRRVVAGQIAEKMLIEFDAGDHDSALAWLRANKLVPAWLMRVDYESRDGSLTEL